MASIGHVAIGMAAARVFTRRQARASRVASMVLWSLLSMAPDADVIGFFFGVRYGDPWGHRGATHSIAVAVLCGAVLEAHDHSAHRIGAAKSSTPEADHCFICHNHSLRSLVSTGPATSACAGEARFDVDDGSGSGVELPTSQPARAPPLV